jgi:hypothetical protein
MRIENIIIFFLHRKMNNSEKKNMLEKKLNDLLSYKNSLSQDNIDDFNNLKSEIVGLLDNNQKIRFNRIDFFSINNEDDETLPF